MARYKNAGFLGLLLGSPFAFLGLILGIIVLFTVANTMLRAVDLAIQVHGALGVTDDTVLAYWYRQERAARIYDGADEVHKTSLGRRIMRRYANR